MATLFTSFRSSSMPKRLLRYCLSKLELLDAEALDMENLDLAFGRNTVFEFRDVGIKLKKLEKLLKLPIAFKLQKAKVLLLRVTIPIDFYTSPIQIEVDGVDVRLKVVGADQKQSHTPTSTEPDKPGLGLNTADIAQSFLETQPVSERRQLEDALAAETQDLGASVSMSDDGSEDEQPLGTGQALSLPAFLGDFLQSVVDRMQVRIKGVKFQLDLEVPVEPNSAHSEPVSFQVAVDRLNVEGVTMGAEEDEASPAIVPKEGKRNINLANIRGFLMSEANVFSALARSPSLASPSVVSSPAMTRNPPSRQTSSLSEDVFSNHPVPGLHESFRSHMSLRGQSPEPEMPLADSEEALSIPYDLSDPEDGLDDESPPTPRASVYHEPGAAVEDSLFHSTLQPGEAMSTASIREGGAASGLWESAHEAGQGLQHSQLDRPAASFPEIEPDALQESSHSEPASEGSAESTEDLTQSHMYTHDDAESMYMSAFSKADSGSASITAYEPSHTVLQEQSSPGGDRPQTPRQAMPGGWGASPDVSPATAKLPSMTEPPAATTNQDNMSPVSNDDANPIELSDEVKPANQFEEEPPQGVKTPSPRTEAPLDDLATPRGPTKLVKELFNLDHISIYVPSQHQHIHVEGVPPDSAALMSQSLGRSIYPQAPGAFSVHSAASGLQNVTAADEPPLKEADKSLEVDFSAISIDFDASIGFLLVMVVGKLLDAIQSDRESMAPATAQKEQSEFSSGAVPDLKVLFQEISINFLNRLGGVADGPERYLDPSAFILEKEILLNATIKDLAISTSGTEVSVPGGSHGKYRNAAGTLTRLDIGMFRFGYADGDIISFDQVRPMSTSVRDTFLSAGSDIGIKLLQVEGKTKTDIETLPLVISIDLQRLDETFSWFGGFSSFLNMSTSMTSTQPSSASSVPSPQQQKPRGVHFETPIDPEDKSATAQNKINLRVGGALVELVGKDCSVAAETSAIKFVSREEGIGIACSRLRVSGPYMRASKAEPAINSEITGVRLDFTMTPKNADLEKLLELILPSKVKFDGNNDEIMVDTLLRQRRKGSVLRANVERVSVSVKNMAQMAALPALGEEIAKLSTVAKYLPEDDRPGLLTLGTILKLDVKLDFGGKLGFFTGNVRQLDVGHITLPSLVALAVHGVTAKRNVAEELVSSSSLHGPVVMARMIGDEMEPVVKLKLRYLTIDYRVPVIMDILGLGEETTPQEFEESLAASVANLGDQAHTALVRQPPSPVETTRTSKPTTVDVGFEDCLFGLNPYKLPSKLIVALTDAHVAVVLPKGVETQAVMDIRKASILLIDDVAQLATGETSVRSVRRSSAASSHQVAELCSRGFVDICYVSSARAEVKVSASLDNEKQITVELRDDLLVLETCADSTQTLITLANALKPPTPPSKENKYKTNVIPVQNLLASISAEAFGRPEGEYDFDQDFAGAQELAGSDSELGDGSDNSLRVDPAFYGSQPEGEEMFDAMAMSNTSHGTKMQETNDGVLLTGYHPEASEGSVDSDDLLIQEDFYSSQSDEKHAAKVWNSNKNRYDQAPSDLVKRSPLKVSVRDVHLIWNLFDGYDWAHTRDVINKAVQDVEHKALERQQRQGGTQSYEEELDDGEAISDFLFNSIYIGIPASRDPQDLTRAINEGLNDNATETESVATTAITATTNRTSRHHQPRSKRLKLTRSRHHKITFELQGVNVDMYAYPAEGETVSSIDVRVQNLDIFDHVPTSTWKKFATYDQDKGEREMGTSMVHLELLNVRPLPELGASEIVLRATVLPLRLHVDQDALDFITRFFEFKDDKVPVHASKSDVPFIQRAEVNNVAVKLDFKPKRVDYAGLRSGHTTEFMNFIVLEESRMVLRHVILYGVSGFDRMGKTLNDIWMPDVRNNQLPGVVAGLAPVRSLVNIGSGFRDLVEIPIKEYKKDGRVVRSISKGAAAFARTTGTELIKLGAKIAVGTQYALQGAEGMLMEQQQPQQVEGSWDDDEDLDPEEKKQISLYAEQPTGVIQGIRGGYRSLTRDMNLARDAIIAVPGEVMESQSASGAARAVLKRAPTIIFRPAVGVSKAIGQTLMGATNTIDPHNQRRIDEKYKKH